MDIKAADGHTHTNRAIEKLAGLVEQTERHLAAKGELAEYAPDIMQAVIDAENMIEELIELG